MLMTVSVTQTINVEATNVTLFLPWERDFVALLHDVLIGVRWQRPHQAKVSDLHRVIGGQQDVAGSQVSVEETLLLQVGHATRHLHTYTVLLLLLLLLILLHFISDI